MSNRDWLDDPNDVTDEEAHMREIPLPHSEYVDLIDEVIDEAFDDDAAEYWQTYGEDEARMAQADAEYDAYMAQWDDDPSPYGGTYSEE